MPVEVIPVGFLRPVLPDRLHLPAAGKTVAQLLGELAIQPDLVAVVLVNGRQAPKDAVLAEGDVVKLIPFVGGG